MPSGFYCKCPASYSGEFCQERVDFCDALKDKDAPVCLNGGICTSLKNTFKCECRNGKEFYLKINFFF